MVAIPRRFSKPILYAVICVIFAGIVAWAEWWGLVLLRQAEAYSEDIRVRIGLKAPLSDRIVFLAIDQRSVTPDQFGPDLIAKSRPLQLMQEGFPWSREVYGHVLERLAEAGASVVAFDLLFPTEREGDEYFAWALDTYEDKAVLGANFVTSSQQNEFGILSLPTPSLIPQTDPPDERVAYVNFWKDDDDVLRRARYHTTFLEGIQEYGLAAEEENPFLYNSMAARMLEKAGLADRLPAGTNSTRLRFAGEPGAIVPISASSIFDPHAWERQFGNGKFFRNKMVIVGPEGNWAKDEIRTPFVKLMPGPEIHLNAVNAAIQRQFLRTLTPTGVWLVFLAAALLALGLTLTLTRPVVRFFCFIGVNAIYLELTRDAFNGFGLLLPIVAPLLVFNGNGFICLVWEIVLERVERLRTRHTLERYVSKNVAKELLDNPTTYFNTLGGVRMPVTILFSDLRGFTTLTESTDDESELVSLLNEFFSEMVEVIFAHDGTLDKFMGDAIMAVWGNMGSKGAVEDTRAAVDAALAMQEALHRLNEDWERRKLPTLAMGVGINHGEVIVGNLGSQEKMELTVIGNSVNLSSRLEGLTKEFGVGILIGENAAVLVDGFFHLQKIANVQVKGKKRPIGVHTVRGRAEEQLDGAMTRYLMVFADGLQLYEHGDFAGAASSFEAALTARPNDPTAAKYLVICEDLRNKPMPEGWNGVFVMTTK